MDSTITKDIAGQPPGLGRRVRKAGSWLSIAGITLLLAALVALTMLSIHRADIAVKKTNEVSELAKSLKRKNDSLISALIAYHTERDGNDILERHIPKKDSALVQNQLAANKGNYKATPKDSIVRTALVLARRIDIPSKGAAPYWVYIGQRTGARWLSNNFNTADVPQPNTLITANTAIYKRDADPQPLPEINWKLGKIIGVLEEGKSVQVVQRKEISGGNWWAEVRDAGVKKGS